MFPEVPEDFAPAGHSNVKHGFEHNDPKGLRDNKGFARQQVREASREAGFGNGFSSNLGNELIPGNAYQDVLDDIATNYGYDIVRHEGIVTLDDYNLELWRVVPQVEVPPTDGHAVLLGHGAAQNGVTWFNNGEDSIAYQLADEGYDVWVLNDRMSGVSQTVHASLTTADAAFWEMSFVEVGDYDIPAAMDYITDNNTNFSDTVTYVGHGTGALAMISSMAEESKNYYDAKLDSVVALSPLSRFGDIGEELHDANRWVYQLQLYLADETATHVDMDNVIRALDDSEITFDAQVW